MSGKLIRLNIIYLMFVSLIPSTTSLKSDYLMEQLPLAIYLIHVILVLIMRLILWTYATGKYRLVDIDIDLRLVKREKMVKIGLICALLASVGFTFINVAAV